MSHDLTSNAIDCRTLCLESEGKLGCVCFASDDLVSTGKYNAGNMLRDVAKIAGGGGHAHMTTAGGKDVSKKQAAIDHFRTLIIG